MISKEEVRLAEWVIQRSCRERKICGGCPHGKNCPLCNNHKCPDDWDVTPQPSEPTERPRIEWLRMLPDDEMLTTIDNERQAFRCHNCKFYSACEDEEKSCNAGHIDWWHEAVTLGQFKKDVGLA